MTASSVPPRAVGGRSGARERLLDAALLLIRRQGYAATSVDALCAAAGVTKGAFFHHFASKEALATAAAARFSAIAEALFGAAPYHAAADPAARALGYVAFRRSIIRGETAAFTCLLGALAQEAYASSEAIRAACADGILGHAATLVEDFDAALAAAGRPEGVTAESLALFTQAVLQGAFILAKATGDPARAIESVDHLHRYLEMLFRRESGRDG